MADKDLLGLNKAEPDHSHDDEKAGKDLLGFNAPKDENDIWGKDDKDKEDK